MAAVIIQLRVLLLSLDRYIVLIMDEMKIQEDLVYDKTGQNLFGFVNLGMVNDELQELEKQANNKTTPSSNIATHMLTLMVRGICTKLEFPYASFPTQGKNNNNIIISTHVGTCIIL